MSVEKRPLAVNLKRVHLVDKFVANPLAGLFAAQDCPFCGLPSDSGQACAGCASDLPWNREACPLCAQPDSLGLPCRRCRRRAHRFDAAWCAFVLCSPIHERVLALKYRARFDAARLLGSLMADTLRDGGRPLPDLLLPMPLHWRRLMRRGYNQALLLANVIGRSLAIPVDARALRRTRATQDQIGQTAAARRRNLRGAFACKRSLSGLHVALIDDVMTTGASFDELARVCRAAGAARVEVWAAARTP